jgi:hypothetical protein
VSEPFFYPLSKMKIHYQLGFIILFFTILQSCKIHDATLVTNDHFEVHDLKMRKTRTSIKYGKREFKNIDSDSILYPHPKLNYYGGCRVDFSQPKLYKYYYCKKCNNSKKERN